MLKKLILLAIALPLTFGTAHAKTAPTEKEQNQFVICSLLSYLTYQAMNNHQNGLSPSQNTTKLHQKFAQTFEQVFGKGSSHALISKAVQTAHEQPKGKTAQEKESLSLTLARGSLEGCADEIGLDLNKFKKS